MFSVVRQFFEDGRSEEPDDSDIVTDGGSRTVDSTAPPDADPNGVTVALDAGDVQAESGSDVRPDLAARHADRLSAILDGTRGGTDDVAEVAAEYAKEGVPTAGYAGTFHGAFDALVDEVFEMARDGDVAAAEAAMHAGVTDLLGSLQSGLDAYDAAAERDPDEYADAFLSIEAVLEAIPFPVYILDADNRVMGWNYGYTSMVGMDREEGIGTLSHESITKAAYSDGKRVLCLADKVIEAPRTAEKEYDVMRDETPYSDHHVYKDTSTTTNLNGEEIEIEFWAVPIFDEDDELQAVFEIINDRTEDVRRHEGMEQLVAEVTTTLERIGTGDLTARAEFEDDDGVVEEELLDIVEEVNQMAGDFETLVSRVDEQTAELAASIESAAGMANRIDDQLGDQNTSLRQVAEEMEDFSATMEEIAASSSEVANAAEQARNEVETGIDAAHDAREVADTVSETSDDLVETVSTLSERMGEIEQVVEVIAEVADKTNILALNANIEAARAGEKGSGFAVVANEVKELADETQTYTEEITTHIKRIKAQSTETVDAVETSHDQVSKLDAEIGATVDAFQEIATAVDDAVAGIDEVADANDDQAARVEEVTSMVEDARADADRVTETAEEILAETEDQQDVVERLSRRVDGLSE